MFSSNLSRCLVYSCRYARGLHWKVELNLLSWRRRGYCLRKIALWKRIQLQPYLRLVVFGNSGRAFLPSSVTKHTGFTCNCSFFYFLLYIFWNINISWAAFKGNNLCNKLINAAIQNRNITHHRNISKHSRPPPFPHINNDLIFNSWEITGIRYITSNILLINIAYFITFYIIVSFLILKNTLYSIK